jgi:methionyl-tRNA formyltransferase
LRLAFLGTPEAAAYILRAIVSAGHEVPLVITRPDKRRGRGAAPSPSPVKACASELGLDVSERVSDATSAGAELGVVVAYGRMIPPGVLERLKMVNVHFSLLPRWRGAAPVERAILAGDEVTGVSLMAVDSGLDSGPVYLQVEVGIGEHESAAALTQRLAVLGADLLLKALSEGLGEAVPQRGEPTYANKIGVDDLRLDWTSPATQLARVVRLGRAWTTWRGKRLLVLSANAVDSPTPAAAPGELVGDVVATGEGGLRLLQVQPEGRRSLAAGDWIRGARPQPGERFEG